MYFNKKFSWHNKMWRSTKRFRGDCPWMPPVATGLIPLFQIPC